MWEGLGGGVGNEYDQKTLHSYMLAILKELIQIDIKTFKKLRELHWVSINTFVEFNVI